MYVLSFTCPQLHMDIASYEKERILAHANQSCLPHTHRPTAN